MGVNIEDSLCGGCVHFRRLLIDEMKITFTLKCASLGKYLKTPKKSCDFYDPVTWERFLELDDGGVDET